MRRPRLHNQGFLTKDLLRRTLRRVSSLFEHSYYLCLVYTTADYDVEDVGRINQHIPDDVLQNIEFDRVK